MRRADQSKVSALQSRSPSRKSGAKVAARHPRPAPLHGSAKRKATGEHLSPGISAVNGERSHTCCEVSIYVTYVEDSEADLSLFLAL